jgi:DNA (cytosine-5)-methyltransferase 1
MVHLDLFSGIGGFALAVDEVWPGSEHIFCEIDPYCKALLKKRFPGSVVYGDIRQLRFDTDSHSNGCPSGQEEVNTAETNKQTLNDIKERNRGGRNGDIRQLTADTDKQGYREKSRSISKFKANESRESIPVIKDCSGRLTADTESGQSGVAETGNRGQDTRRGSQDCFILTGGFPCQPFSQAGKRKGTDDNRYLWPEMLRVIRDFKPTWVIAENVRGLLTINEGLVFQQVCLDLEGEGYEVQPFIIPAVAVNAPHRRDRVWFVANRKCERCIGGSAISKSELTRLDKKKQTGEIAWSFNGRCNEVNASESNVKQLEGSKEHHQRGEHRQKRSQVRSSGGTDSSDAPDTKQPRWSYRISGQEQEGSAGECGNETAERNGWERNWLEVATELCRVDDGLPAELDGLKLSKSRHRVERLKALGNAIVPQVAVEIMKGIKCTTQN